MPNERIDAFAPQVNAQDLYPKKTGLKISGIILITGGVAAVLAAGIFGGIYGSQHFANAFNAAALTGSITGKITLIALASGGTLLLVVGGTSVHAAKPPRRVGYRSEPRNIEPPQVIFPVARPNTLPPQAEQRRGSRDGQNQADPNAQGAPQPAPAEGQEQPPRNDRPIEEPEVWYAPFADAEELPAAQQQIVVGHPQQQQVNPPPQPNPAPPQELMIEPTAYREASNSGDAPRPDRLASVEDAPRPVVRASLSVYEARLDETQLRIALELHDILNQHDNFNRQITDDTMSIHPQTWILANFLARSSAAALPQDPIIKAHFLQTIIFGNTDKTPYQRPFPFTISSVDVPRKEEDIKLTNANTLLYLQILAENAFTNGRQSVDTQEGKRRVLFKTMNNFFGTLSQDEVEWNIVFQKTTYNLNKKFLEVLEIIKVAYINHLSQFSKNEKDKLLVTLRSSPFYDAISKYHGDGSNRMSTSTLKQLLLDASEEKSDKRIGDIESIVGKITLQEADEDLQEILCWQLLNLMFHVNDASQRFSENVVKAKLQEQGIISKNSEKRERIVTKELSLYLILDRDLRSADFNLSLSHIYALTSYDNPESMLGRAITISDSVSKRQDQFKFNPLINYAFSANASDDQIINLVKLHNPNFKNEISGLIQRSIKDLNKEFDRIEGIELSVTLNRVVTKFYILLQFIQTYRKLSLEPFNDQKVFDFADRLENLSIKALSWEKALFGENEMRAQISHFNEKVMLLKATITQGTEYSPKVTQEESQHIVHKIKSDKYALALNQLQSALEGICSNNALKTTNGLIGKATRDLVEAKRNLENVGRTIAQVQYDLDRYAPGWKAPIYMVADYASSWRNWWNNQQPQAIKPKDLLENELGSLNLQRAKLSDLVGLIEATLAISTHLSGNRSATQEFANRTREQISNAAVFKDDKYLNEVRTQMLGYIENLSNAAAIILKYFDRPDELGNQDLIGPYLDTVTSLNLFTHTSINLEAHLQEISYVGSVEGKAVLVPQQPQPASSAIMAALRETNAEFKALFDKDTLGFFTAGRFDRIARSTKNSVFCYLYPNREGNPHHEMFSIKFGSKTTKIIAHGTPTKQEGTVEAEVVPEWRLLLKTLIKLKKPYAYVSFQNLIPPHAGHFLEENESVRAMQIMDTIDGEETGCYGMTLSKDSEIYKQKAGVTQKAHEFINDLCLMTRPEGAYGCYFGKKMNQLPYYSSESIKLMLQTIYKHMFKGKAPEDDMTPKEKRIFQGIFYLCMFVKNMKDLKLEFMSIICKDMADRAMMEVLKLFVSLGLLTNREAEPGFIKRAKAYLVGRAYETRKRPPVAQRVDRCFEELDYIIEHKEDWIALFKELFPGEIPEVV